MQFEKDNEIAMNQKVMEGESIIEEMEKVSVMLSDDCITNSDSDLNSIDSRSIDSLSTVEDILEDEPLILAQDTFLPPPEAQTEITGKIAKKKKRAPLDVDKYMAAREMTATQERWNALTMIPSPLYCLYYIFVGLWISPEMKHEFRDVDTIDDSKCIQSDWFPNLVAFPPGAVLAVFIAISIHAPFSFLYHWKYAHALPPGLPRTTHWSRRMDHAMIHTASVFLSYATSGSWDYLLVNLLFNADCIYRQFKKKVRPRRNQIRVGLSIVAYTIPILNRGEISLFLRCWVVLYFAGWFFIKYPVGGWSHSVFHIIIAFLPPLIMQAASTLPSSREYMEVAAKCAVLSERAI